MVCGGAGVALERMEVERELGVLGPGRAGRGKDGSKGKGMGCEPV